MSGSTAFDDWVSASQSRLLRYAYLLCADREEARDVVQDVYSRDPDTCIEGYGVTSGVVVHVLDRSGVRDLFLRVDGCRLLGSDDGSTRRLLTEDMCIPLFREETPNMVTGQGVDPTLCWR